MTALFGYAKGQLHATIHSPRRLNVLLLVLLVLATLPMVFVSPRGVEIAVLGVVTGFASPGVGAD